MQNNCYDSGFSAIVIGHMKKKKLYILDVSGYIFRAYFALPPMTNARGEPTHALFGFIRSIFKIFKDFSPEHIVAVFDGPDNTKQRRELYEKYKAHRVREYGDLPEQIEMAKIFCGHMGIACVEIGGVEADDAMGSIARLATQAGYEAYLCTSDKDLCQLVDEHTFVLNTWKDNLIIDRPMVKKLYGVEPSQMADLLAIMGDSSDNIPGIKGFGPKTAILLLEQFGSLDNLLEQIEQVKGEKKQQLLKESSEIARLSKRLATIHVDVTIPHDSSFFCLKEQDETSLRHFYLDRGFDSLARELEKELPQETEASYHLIESPEALKELITKLHSAAEIAFDCAATDMHPQRAEIVGIAFCFDEHAAFYIPFKGALAKEDVIAQLKPLFENPDIKFFAHNAKYDLHLLDNLGIALNTLSFDTILASYLLNSSSRRHALDHLVAHYFNKSKTAIKELIGSGKKEVTLAEVSQELVANYCCEDVHYTFKLKKVLEKELAARKLDHLLYAVELPFTRLLAKMERVGMFVDKTCLHHFAQEVTSLLKGLEQEIFVLANEEFNINSPKQLAYILFDKLKIKPLKKTATGLSTNADVLEKLAVEYPIAQKILAFRALEKLRSTYIEALPKGIEPKSGRIHPTFSQYGTATGRLSCQDPNLQNIPVRTEQGRRIREAFRPQQKGWSYLAADYSQIELRLLAHMSRDPRLVEAFLSGEDVHAFTASLVFNTPLSQVTDLERQRAKAINFGIIYGQQAFGLSQELGVEVKEALAFIEAYFERYPKVLEFINGTIESARQSGRAVTMSGREREIPEIHSSNAVLRAQAERLAINTPLQGSTADLIKEAMLQIDKILIKKKMHSQMVLQIHDELLFEAPDAELPELERIVKQTMEHVAQLIIPLIVEVNVGKNWAEV